MFCRLILASAIALAAAAPVAAQPARIPPQTRQVSFELRENGAVVTRSRLRLRLGMQAAIPVDGPYAVRLRVDQGADGGYSVQPVLTRVMANEQWRPVPTQPVAVTSGAQTRVRLRPAATPAVEMAVQVD
jgi:hypothetical protein